MDAAEVVRRLVDTIDAHRWEGLPDLLAPGFSSRLVHTGETFDRDAWVRLNADYPGFERMHLEDLVAQGDRAACRAHVTGVTEGRTAHFEVAMFVTVTEGVIQEMTEVWADGDSSPPEGTRPG
ncbi:nuclear transport factor 2 family protein [Serinicoccus kebangsaanensis]|uniref:nuclear transport factor 2 family protein n=1 Tax=Serinicoccus kebangsaanensis TaxID=2602069 RepID=UPI00124D591B|nr:nuclear transport factor 2 family protein [Serinicoccus kebangsaanensis]